MTENGVYFEFFSNGSVCITGQPRGTFGVECGKRGYCRQCSIELFGEDRGDLADYSRARSLDQNPTLNGRPGVQGWAAMCDGCNIGGGILVAQDGTCVTAFCDKHGKGAPL